MANIRPVLRKGDLVRRKRPHDDGTVYKVTSMKADRIERRKLRLSRGSVVGSEGFIHVHVICKLGTRATFRRRELWRIPNQPRERKKQQVGVLGLGLKRKPTLPTLTDHISLISV